MDPTNRYRVDRVPQGTVEPPCGMTSIVAISSEEKRVHKEFQSATLGVDAWGQPNPTYGVILSQWDGNRYVVKDSRFP